MRRHTAQSHWRWTSQPKKTIRVAGAPGSHKCALLQGPRGQYAECEKQVKGRGQKRQAIWVMMQNFVLGYECKTEQMS